MPLLWGWENQMRWQKLRSSLLRLDKTHYSEGMHYTAPNLGHHNMAFLCIFKVCYSRPEEMMQLYIGKTQVPVNPNCLLNSWTFIPTEIVNTRRLEHTTVSLPTSEKRKKGILKYLYTGKRRPRKEYICWIWWFTSVMPVPRRLRLGINSSKPTWPHFLVICLSVNILGNWPGMISFTLQQHFYMKSRNL